MGKELLVSITTSSPFIQPEYNASAGRGVGERENRKELRLP